MTAIVQHDNPKVLFLPGAAGAASFWHGVGAQLPVEWEKVYLSWPGLGSEAPSDSVQGFDDCVRLVEQHLTRSCDLVAQSMGGVIAIRVALKNVGRVRRLVLAATSGGIDVASLGGADWRTDYRAEYPDAARWIAHEPRDHTEDLKRLPMPTLLLCGDKDIISPVAVGERLRSLLPDAVVHVVEGGTHTFAYDDPALVSPLIFEHLRTRRSSPVRGLDG